MFRAVEMFRGLRQLSSSAGGGGLGSGPLTSLRQFCATGAAWQEKVGSNVATEGARVSAFLLFFSLMSMPTIDYRSTQPLKTCLPLSEEEEEGEVLIHPSLC